MAPPAVYLGLVYEDADAAITFLEGAFGFKTVTKVPSDPGKAVHHAELMVSETVIMLGDEKLQDRFVSPKKLDTWQEVYVYIKEIDSHYATAKAYGIEIVEKLHKADDGASYYTAKDCEGLNWMFGSCFPKAGNSAVCPILTYSDCTAAIQFLTEAFGFETSMLNHAEQGGKSLCWAEIHLNGAAIIVEDEHPNKGQFGSLGPKKLPGLTQRLYVALEDVERHYRRTKAAGAEIVSEPDYTLFGSDHSSYQYTAKDSEGYTWTFGTYLPKLTA